ncbi:hypothetical protein A1O3_04169 [Capronia epimyces CBS 606.96]|uniref:Zn(2)-C6 fungal-type domain-containing protein n=1 Tax=Capronia epimyces CBS 606.96 TaxID=1182542 RepID=W9YC03_9EURO|nr:uncharacterized protein A1O3_04169 [Capronia epimyces CBS 606.96]EXJ87210.1 hypothetical protein A1O3_04169 [Capronia epimyces CBS 606.96]
MEESALPRGFKRRASKACLSCRARKVRCDVNDRMPCTNCRLDGVECKVAESLRQRKRRVEPQRARRATPEPSVEEDQSPPQFAIFDDIPGLQCITPLPSVPNTGSRCDAAGCRRDSARSRDQDASLDGVSQLKGSDKDDTNADTISVGARSTHAQLPLSPPSQSSPTTTFGQRRVSLSQDVALSLPRFIRKIPTRLAAEDVEYLQRKGAFVIPDTALRNELLRCYVQFVHPYMPVLDLQDFLSAIEQNEPANAVSLMLFQAVMFAATPYVAARTLAAHGYSNRRMARRSFYLRIKSLCDMDYEVDRVTIIQSSLLMTYWNETPDDPKDVWYWLGVAVSLSKAIGLNYDPSPFPPHNIQKRRLWKRIWWSCYMRDRLVSLAFRRPSRISQNTFDQPMLELSDFETKPLSGEVSRMLGPPCPTISNEAVRISLAQLCLGMASLCVCLTPILEMQCSTPGISSIQARNHKTNTTPAPAQAVPDPCDMLQCDKDLRKWYRAHAQELCCFGGMSSGTSPDDSCDVLDLHRAVLKAVYLTSISTLHRPQILSMATHSTDPEIRDLSRRKTREAANDLTILFTNLYAHGLVRFLPNTGVTCVLHAAIVHILDQTVGDPDLKQTSTRKFALCMQALEQLGDMYASGAFACSFLTAAANKVSSRAGSTEAMVGLNERLPDVQVSDGRGAPLQFEYQFNVPPSTSGAVQAGGVGPGPARTRALGSAAIISSSEDSRKSCRPDPAVRASDAPLVVSGDTDGDGDVVSTWRRYQGVAEPGFHGNGNKAVEFNREPPRVTGRPGVGASAGDEMQLDLDSFLDMEGCADFFKLSDELGVGFDTQWLDAFDPQIA